MLSNDVLRSVRYLLKTTDSALAGLFERGGAKVSPQQVIAWLKAEEGEPGFVRLPDFELACFLDGLVIERRGPPTPEQKRPPEKVVTNNVVLKKLRVAFELKEDDLIALMRESGFEVSRAELSALFRTPGHQNYRPCGDQFLRNFLKALTARVRRD